MPLYEPCIIISDYIILNLYHIMPPGVQPSSAAGPPPVARARQPPSLGAFGAGASEAAARRSRTLETFLSSAPWAYCVCVYVCMCVCMYVCMYVCNVCVCV